MDWDYLHDSDCRDFCNIRDTTGDGRVTVKYRPRVILEPSDIGYDVIDIVRRGKRLRNPSIALKGIGSCTAVLYIGSWCLKSELDQIIARNPDIEFCISDIVG